MQIKFGNGNHIYGPEYLFNTKFFMLVDTKSICKQQFYVCIPLEDTLLCIWETQLSLCAFTIWGAITLCKYNGSDCDKKFALLTHPSMICSRVLHY